jgi:hypothetical protein
MPEISLLEPTVLRGVVEKLTAPEDLTLIRRLPRQPHPYPTATWDVIRGSRMVAKPNYPNSEAHIVPRLGVSQESASFIYLREKKVFEPTTIHWIRTPGQIAATNAERAVLREVTDLNQRFDNFAEFCAWKAMTGTLILDYPDVQATIDYKVPASHKPSAGTSWASATPAQIRADVVAWKRLLSRDARVAARDIFATEATMERIMNAFAVSTEGGGLFLSDRMKDQFYSAGVIPGFMGLNWNVVEQQYEDDNGNTTLFVPDDTLYMANLDDGRAMEILEGPTADDEAPDGFTGKFSKTWKEKDPSARQYLLEWHFLPVITRPEQIVYVADVAP